MQPSTSGFEAHIALVGYLIALITKSQGAFLPSREGYLPRATRDQQYNIPGITFQRDLEPQNLKTSKPQTSPLTKTSLFSRQWRSDSATFIASRVSAEGGDIGGSALGMRITSSGDDPNEIPPTPPPPPPRPLPRAAARWSCLVVKTCSGG